LRRAGDLPPPPDEERTRYFAAHERYAGYRDEARGETEPLAWEVAIDEMRKVRSLHLTEMDDVAIGFWDIRWRSYPSPYSEGNFPWSRIISQVRTTPRHFDLAIWADGILCGLCAGMAAKRKHYVAISFLESFHGPNPLKGLVAAIAVECAEAYAQILGAGWLKIRNPVAGALPQYEALGFRLVRPRRAAPYCQREL
jgi:hypothetical protein